MKTLALVVTALFLAGPALADGDQGTCANCHTSPKQKSTLTSSLVSSDPNAQMYDWIMSQKGQGDGAPAPSAQDKWNAQHAQGQSCAKCHASSYSPAPKADDWSWAAKPSIPCKTNCHAPNNDYAYNFGSTQKSPFFTKMSPKDVAAIQAWIQAGNTDTSKTDAPAPKMEEPKKAPAKKQAAAPKPAKDQLADAQNDKGGGTSFDGGGDKTKSDAKPGSDTPVVVPPTSADKKNRPGGSDWTPDDNNKPGLKTGSVPAPGGSGGGGGGDTRDKVVGGIAGAGVGAGAGALIGLVAGGPMGALIGGLIGGLLGALFGIFG